MNIPSFKNWRIVGSGQGGNHRKAGVAILFSPKCRVEEYTIVDSARIISAKIWLNGQPLLVTSCYTPDMSYAESTRGAFWKKLNKYLEKVPKIYQKIGAGDFNACLVPDGEESRGFGNFHPRCCYQKAKVNNDNGNELLQTVSDQNMFLENTYFKNKKACHSWTHHNIGGWKRRYDFFMVDSLVHKFSTQCRSYPSPISSDHRLVLLKFKLPTKKQRKINSKKKKSKKLPRPNIKLLAQNNDIRVAYQEMLEELCSDSNTHENLDNLDEIINKFILEATSKTVPVVQKQHAATWMTEEYIKLREITYENRKSRNKNLKKLRKLQNKLQNKFFSDQAAALNQAAADKDAEKTFRLSKEFKTILKKNKCRVEMHRKTTY